MTRFLAFLGVSLLAATTAHAATPTLFGVTFDNELIRINPASGASTLVGHFQLATAAPMGIGTFGGELYVLEQISQRLLVVDPNDAHTVRSVAVTAPDGHVGSEGDFTISPAGVGYYAEGNGTFASLDLTTGVSVNISQSLPTNIDGIAFAGNGTLYAELAGGAFGTIDPVTGTYTSIGAFLALPGSVGGLDFRPADGVAFAAHDNVLYTKNVSTGAATTVGSMSFDNVAGIRFAEVPEPSLACVAAVAAGCAGALSRRRCGRWNASGKRFDANC